MGAHCVVRHHMQVRVVELEVHLDDARSAIKPACPEQEGPDRVVRGSVEDVWERKGEAVLVETAVEYVEVAIATDGLRGAP